MGKGIFDKAIAKVLKLLPGIGGFLKPFSKLSRKTVLEEIQIGLGGLGMERILDGIDLRFNLGEPAVQN